MPADKTITQTIFAVQFTSRSFPLLRDTPGCLIWHLPLVFICHQLSADCILSLQIQHNEWFHILLQRLQLVGGGLSVTLGAPGHLSISKSVPCHLYNSFKGLLPHQPEGLGDVEKFHSDITFLLVSTKEGATGDRVYGLSMIWVNSYQARVSIVEEAVKQLTALVSIGPDWPYALVQLNGDTHYAPLPREGHLSILPQRRHQQCHLQKGQPTRGLPASQLSFAGHLPSRAEQVWDPCDSLPAQVSGQRCKLT